MWGSEVANYKTEIHIARYNERGDVVMQCHHLWVRGGQVQTVSVDMVTPIDPCICGRPAEIQPRPDARVVSAVKS